MGQETVRPVALASRGEFLFDDDVGHDVREVIREMWINRLAGFRARDLRRYLRDNVESTLYITDGRAHSYRAFRRMSRVLFLLRRIAGLIGFTVSAEMLDGRVSRTDDLYVARGVLVLMLGGWMISQSHLAMSCHADSGRWVWERAVVERIGRRSWPWRHDTRGQRQWRMSGGE